MKSQENEPNGLEELLRRAEHEESDLSFDLPGEETAPKTEETSEERAENTDETGENEPKDSRERQDERDEKARKAYITLISNDDEDEPIDISLRSLLGGDMLGGRWFLRQLPYLLLVAVLTILYVANRYSCQRAEIVRDDLKSVLEDRKFKSLTISSELTRYTMRQNIEGLLPDSTLHTSTTSSYQLP